MFDYKALIEQLKNNEFGTTPTRIAVVGAGGKTTTMYALGKHYASCGLKVLVTTTTRVIKPSLTEVDRVVIHRGIPRSIRGGQVTFVGSSCSRENKVKGYTPEQIEKWDLVYDVLIYEADGANRKAIKAPREDEPVLISNTDICIGLVGLDVLMKPASEAIVHRFDHFKKITGIKEIEPIGAVHIKRLVQDKKGLFKDVEGHTKKVLLLSKMDNENRENYASQIKVLLESWEGSVIAI